MVWWLGFRQGQYWQVSSFRNSTVIGFFPPFAISGSVYNRYRAYERISFFVYTSVWRSRLNLWDAFILLGYMFCLPSFPQPFDRPFPSKFGKLCSLTRLPRSELRVRFPWHWTFEVDNSLQQLRCHIYSSTHFNFDSWKTYVFDSPWRLRQVWKFEDYPDRPCDLREHIAQHAVSRSVEEWWYDFELAVQSCTRTIWVREKLPQVVGLTLNLQSLWRSKNSLKVCRQSACISGRLAIQVPETGTRRWVYLRKIMSGICH